ncbi:MAG: LPS export ABC transporter permease LptF [Pseudomonadales bacterium]|nr:LPS export ABC transporter permease LptF [Pseudomonadales bacterium]
MIIFRYLAKNVVVTMLAVTAVLLLIIMSGRFIKYLAEAAAGELGVDVLFSLIGYKLPSFLELILPLGLFLGILMSYGRLYLDSEMTVLSACGMSTKRLLFYTMMPSLFVMLLVGLLSLELSPWGTRKVDEIFRAQDARTEFDALVPGRFQELGGGGRVTYTEKLTDKRKRMGNVFISQRIEKPGKKPELILLVAESGSQYIDEATGSHFLLLENGYRYDGDPGDPEYRIIQYEKYGVNIPKPAERAARVKAELKPTLDLINSTNPQDIAQLQWRLSLPLLVPIITLIAIPLSRVNPRQGRWLRLLPSIFLYMGYLVLLSTTRTAIEDGKLSPQVGLIWVHVLFFAIGVILIGNLHHKIAWFRRSRQ